MSTITDLSIQQLRYIANLKERIEALQDELAQIVGTSSGKRKFKMSASARARIAAAQRARWAKVNKTKKPGSDGRKSKRTMSASAKAKIAAAARARWAKAKASGKNRL